ncbi:MAG TPA: helix-turn-helix transcriptional regulator [Ktedonobacteraceae bacterium]|nr:helix-turn-helix transcriptional regulator [Ktedonobacteraceae bacterium]
MEHGGNEFGKLVRAYRKQRAWTQGELAERWGYTREYVSHIEAGRRKLDSISQLVRLADLLDIPSEKLEAAGRSIPERKAKTSLTQNVDNPLLPLLLTQGLDKVKFSYMVWLTNQHASIETNLKNMVDTLNSALTMYHGEFMKPARQLLAYTHQMLGKIAFDALDYEAAGKHFSEMVSQGQKLNDADTIALGMIRQGDILRKRGRYEMALRCFEAVKPYADVSDYGIQGLRYLNMARAYYFLGDEEQFLGSINPALELASQVKEGNDSLAYWFNLDVAFQFQASGYTALKRPGRAIEVYRKVDQLRLSRPLRDQGAYIIEKARAYLALGDLEKGTILALKGLKLATRYKSRRHIARLELTYNNLRITPFGKEKQLHVLKDALIEAQRKLIEESGTHESC